MLKRFVIAYLAMGLVVSSLLNFVAALHGASNAFEWSATAGKTVQHFLISFGVPLLTWPVVVFSGLLRVMVSIFNVVARALRF